MGLSSKPYLFNFLVPHQRKTRIQSITFSLLISTAFRGTHVLLILCCHSLANLRMRDELIMQSLTEKQQLFAALYETITEQETPHKGLLLRGDTSDLQQGTTLLKGAIYEGKSSAYTQFNSSVCDAFLILVLIIRHFASAIQENIVAP